MAEQPKKPAPSKEGKVFINQRFYDQDFSDRDLTHADFRGCKLVNCNFDGANCSYANFESANCYGSSFKRTNLYHANFKDAVLAEADFDPRDLFGITVSMTCDTFDKLKMTKLHVAFWVFNLLLLDIEPEMKEQLKTLLISWVGEERLKGMVRAYGDRAI